MIKETEPIDRMKYVQIMRSLREDSNLTQQQVAGYLGTSQTMYARYERGANEIPVHHLIRLCTLFHVTAGQFLGLEPLKRQEERRTRTGSLLTSANEQRTGRWELSENGSKNAGYHWE